MNLASQSGERQTDLLFVNFNQDYSSLSVGTKTGYKIYSLSSQDKLECIYENVSENNIIVERLFASSLLAVVSLAAPRKLKVNHFKKGTEICNYSYSNSILAVKLNRQRLVVCLEESLYIHSIRDMKVMHTIRETPPNTKGLCALASCSENSYLAYPGSNTTGEVQIFDTISLRAVTIIAAHQSPLAALSFSHDGLKLATASEKGTVIRIYSIPDGIKIFEFRRGVKRNVTINSMSFSSCGNFLSASSNTETVHVFKLEVVKDKPVEEPQSWMGWMGAALKSSAHYLPQGVSEVFNQGRSFAVARLPTSGFKNICALQMQGKVPRLYVASEDGFFYSFNFDPSEGGELTLNKQLSIGARLDGQGDEAAAGSESPPQERPLASQPTPATYAATARRGEPTPAPAPGKPPHPASPATTIPSPWRSGESYAAVLKRKDGGPQDVAAELQSTVLESHAYQELEATISGSPDLMSRELGSLQLDNVAEFPPVGHKTE